jgi:L-ribulose-5-phosphate 4-epimerase
MTEEGYVKYSSNWIKTIPLPYGQIEILNCYRQKLYDLGLIGAYENGIGFGNISQRWREDQFIISGSATGNLHELSADHYTLVVDFDTALNQLTCKGPVQASSESMSHGVIYRQNRKINAVIHVHSADMWNALLYKIPTTGKEIAYGTPEMAMEIIRLFQDSDVNDKKIFAMAGHEDGIFSFGKDMEEALGALLNA